LHGRVRTSSATSCQAMAMQLRSNPDRWLQGSMPRSRRVPSTATANNVDVGKQPAKLQSMPFESCALIFTWTQAQAARALATHARVGQSASAIRAPRPGAHAFRWALGDGLGCGAHQCRATPVGAANLPKRGRRRAGVNGGAPRENGHHRSAFASRRFRVMRSFFTCLGSPPVILRR